MITLTQNNETYTFNSMAHKNQRTVPFGAKLMKNNKQNSDKQEKILTTDFEQCSAVLHFDMATNLFYVYDCKLVYMVLQFHKRHTIFVVRVRGQMVRQTFKWI